MERTHRRGGFRFVVLLVVTATSCLSDLFTGPGNLPAELVYSGDSLIIAGSRLVAPVTVRVGTTPLPNARLRFTSSDSSVLAFAGTGDSLVAAGRGRATLTVTLQGGMFPDPGPSVSRELRVIAKALTLERPSVTLTSLDDTMMIGATALNVNDQPIPGTKMQWESADTTVALVNSKGRVIARKSGNTEVRAIVDFDTARATVRVRQDLAEIRTTPASLLLSALDQDSLIVAAGRDAHDNEIPDFVPAWESSNSSVASVDAAGRVRARQNGRAYVRVRGGSLIDSVTVLVDQRATQVVIAPKPVPAISAVGGQRQLAVAALDQLGHTVIDAAPTWGTLTPLVLRVSPEGLVTALAQGNGQVVASLDGAADTVLVPVHDEPVSVDVFPATATLASIDDTLQLRFTARNARADTIPGVVPSWSTPDGAVVDLSATGRVVARATGTARVVATLASLSDTSVITVTNAPATINIMAAVDTLASIGDTLLLPVEIRNSRGAPLPITSVTWSSDDRNVARVTSLGEVIAQDSGRTVVRATHAAIQDSVVVVVTNAPAFIALDGSLDTLTALGQSLTYHADVRNARGNPIAGYPVSWRSTNGAVAGVGSEGTTTALGFGSALIIGHAGTHEDSVTFVVRNPTMLHVNNGVVVQSRFGTRARPYARIQDALAAADASDTVLVATGASPYAETVALSRRITLLGDSTAYLAANQDPLLLPRIAHDSGASGVTVYTSAPVTIRYFTLVHTLDGAAVDAQGSDVVIEHLHVNPPGTVSSRVGRGILIKDSPSGSRVTHSSVRSVRGFGIRFDNVFNGAVEDNVVQMVDSVPGFGGAGIRIRHGGDDGVRRNVLAATAGPEVFLDSTASVQVTANTLHGRRSLVRVLATSGATQIRDNLFDLAPQPGEVLGSAFDGRAGLEILGSLATAVSGNTFSDPTTSSDAMDGVFLDNAHNVSLTANQWSGGRYQIRSQRSQWGVSGSRFGGAVSAIFAAVADTIALSYDTLTPGRGPACVTAPGSTDVAVTVDRTLFSSCTPGGAAIAIDGPGGTLDITASTFAGGDQRSVAFDSRRFTAHGSLFSGLGGSAPPYTGAAAIAVQAIDSIDISRNEISNFAGFAGIFAAGNEVQIDSNRVNHNAAGIRIGDMISINAVDNDIADNLILGVANETATLIVLDGNWWGDLRGPRRSNTPTAAGDSIAGPVDYTPLRTTPFDPGSVASGLRIVRGNNQTERAKNNLPRPLTARVIDVAGRPVAGVSVTFTVTAGGGSFAGGFPSVALTSNLDGLAETVYKLGATVGLNTVTVTGTTLPLGSITFTSTATP